MRVINNQDIGTLTRHGTAHTNSKVIAALVGIPPTSGL
jgi:hypothetical protein